ncbi:MAG: hypothetical protein AAGF91_08685 [Actinomycetota bacterium]
MTLSGSVLQRLTCDRALGGTIGESDCELLRDGLLAQPVLTWTSLAYVAAAVGLAITTRVVDARRTLATAFVVSLALIGIGSVLFHGPQPDGTRWIHDVPIVACLLSMVAIDAAQIGVVTIRQATAFWLAGTVTTAVVAAVAADVALVVGAVTVAALVVAEVLVRRPRRTWVPLLTVGVVAAVLNGSGRTDAPLCDPESVVQWHGVWHVLTAFGFVLWGRAALVPDRAPA